MSTLSIHVPVSKAAAVVHNATVAAVRLLIEECRTLPEAVKECRGRAGSDEAAAKAELMMRLPHLTSGCMPPDLRPVLLLSSVRWETVADAVCRVWDEEAIVRYEAELRDEIEAMLLAQEIERAEAQLGERWDGLG